MHVGNACWGRHRGRQAASVWNAGIPALSCNPDPAGASLSGVGWGRRRRQVKTSPALAVLSAMHLSWRMGDDCCRFWLIYQWDVNFSDFLLQGTMQVQIPRVDRCISSLHMHLGHVRTSVCVSKISGIIRMKQGTGRQNCKSSRPLSVPNSTQPAI